MYNMIENTLYIDHRVVESFIGCRDGFLEMFCGHQSARIAIWRRPQSAWQIGAWIIMQNSLNLYRGRKHKLD